MLIKQGQHIEVHWVDAAQHPGWHGAEEARSFSCASCQTSGYLIELNKHVINVAQSKGDSGQVGDCIVIPRSCVKKIIKLK